MTLAGYISTKAKWIRFENEWNRVLGKYEVPYLHMKEFTCSTGPFKTWKGKEDLRKAFLVDLIKVAKKNVHKGFGMSVRIVDFEEVNRDYKLREHWGNEYSFVGMSVVSWVEKYRKKRFPQARVKYVFEDGDAGNDHLKQRLKAEHLPYAFIPKKERQNGTYKYIVPFQIADFAAWENRAAFARFHDGKYNYGDPDDPLKEFRQSFQALYKQIPSYLGVFTDEDLRRLCKSKNLHRHHSASSSPPCRR